MFKIGDFSRLCMVPVSALRFYADIGLFEPQSIDPNSGYRYYTADQLPRLNRILALKDLGLSLDETKVVLDTDLSAAELRGMLRRAEAESSRRMEQEEIRLDRVRARLRLIEKEGVMPEQEVVVKEVPPLRGLGLRTVLGSPAEIGGLIGDGFAGLGMAGAHVSGPPTAVYHDPEFDPDKVDVEVVYPTGVGKTGEIVTPGGRRLKETMIPGGVVASLVHAASYESIGDSYQALAGWIGEHGYRISGPCYELYMSGPDEPGPPVTEIRMPIVKD